MTEERKTQQNIRIFLLILSLVIFMLTLTAGFIPNDSAEEKLNSVAPNGLYESTNAL
ncbi:MAG: hypothetical protein AB8G95_31235 [Anaerolineae bacterium]